LFKPASRRGEAAVVLIKAFPRRAARVPPNLESVRPRANTDLLLAEFGFIDPNGIALCALPERRVCFPSHA